MTGIVDHFYDELVYLHAHMRPAFVTFEEFLEWRERDPEVVDCYEAEDFARFVKKVATDADVPNLIGAAENILRVARAISKRPIAYDAETGSELQTLPHDHWQADLDRRAKRNAERSERPARWDARERVTTSDISGLLWPEERPGFATTYVFGMLKDLGYVEGAPRSWRLTKKGSRFGESKGPRGFIYWSKDMLEVVRVELERRRAESKI